MQDDKMRDRVTQIEMKELFNGYFPWFLLNFPSYLEETIIQVEGKLSELTTLSEEDRLYIENYIRDLKTFVNARSESLKYIVREDLYHFYLNHPGLAALVRDKVIEIVNKDLEEDEI